MSQYLKVNGRKYKQVENNAGCSNCDIHKDNIYLNLNKNCIAGLKKLGTIPPKSHCYIHYKRINIFELLELL